MELLCKAKGISVLSGASERSTISSNDLYPAFDDYVYNMTERIKEALEETPPELHGDIIQDGIIMTGGGSLIYGLDKRISGRHRPKWCCTGYNRLRCKRCGIALTISTQLPSRLIYSTKKHTSRLKKEDDILIMKNEPIHTNKRRNPKILPHRYPFCL